jgi:predicted nuclease with TOPRIM domain
MSDNTEIDNHNREINILKSTIDKLTQENKQLLESNKQLKKEYDKLRDFNISILAGELETQIQHILGWSTVSLEYYESPQQFSQRFPNWGREDIVRMAMLTRNAALKLHLQVEHMKHDVSRGTLRRF